MERRKFLKYSALTSSTVIFPQLLQASLSWRDATKILYVLKLHPVRFIAGLIFNKVKEIFLKPLATSVFNIFLYVVYGLSSFLIYKK